MCQQQYGGTLSSQQLPFFFVICLASCVLSFLFVTCTQQADTVVQHQLISHTRFFLVLLVFLLHHFTVFIDGDYCSFMLFFFFSDFVAEGTPFSSAALLIAHQAWGEEDIAGFDKRQQSQQEQCRMGVTSLGNQGLIMLVTMVLE